MRRVQEAEDKLVKSLTLEERRIYDQRKTTRRDGPDDSDEEEEEDFEDEGLGDGDDDGERSDDQGNTADEGDTEDEEEEDQYMAEKLILGQRSDSDDAFM